MSVTTRSPRSGVVAPGDTRIPTVGTVGGAEEGVQCESRSSTVTRGTTSSNWRPFARAAGVARGGRNFYRLAAVLAVICAIVSGCGGGAGSTTDSNNSADTLAPLSCSNPAYSGYSSSTCQCARGVASACPSGPDDSVTRERTEPRRPEPPRPEPTPLDVKP